jgi:hypothetical protein
MDIPITINQPVDTETEPVTDEPEAPTEPLAEEASANEMPALVVKSRRLKTSKRKRRRVARRARARSRPAVDADALLLAGAAGR